MGNLWATPKSGRKAQTTSLSLYLGPQPDNELVTLCRLTRKGRIIVTAFVAPREAGTEKLTETWGPRIFANTNDFPI